MRALDWVTDPLVTVPPFDQVSYIAIAIRATHAGQRHLGILHRTQNGPAQLLHLAWHHKLTNEPPSPRDVWIDPQRLPRSIRRALSGFCRLVAERYRDGEIPYGLANPDTRFDLKTGTVLIEETETGLTCATFVMALFRTHNAPILRTAEWPLRAEDDLWLEQICDALAGSATPEHIESMRRKRGNFQRFRPEEVAAGAAMRMPAGFALSSERGRLLVQLLNERSSLLYRARQAANLVQAQATSKAALLKAKLRRLLQ